MKRNLLYGLVGIIVGAIAVWACGYHSYAQGGGTVGTVGITWLGPVTPGNLISVANVNQVQDGNMKPDLTGTTASFGGGALLLGQCVSGTATVTGATTSMAASVSQAGGTDIGAGLTIEAWVSSANTVTVRRCALLSITPTSQAYNVRVHQ